MAYDQKMIGTVDYLSPEQALDSHKVDSRVDIYSLGCTLYFMLSGDAPFPQGTIPQRLMAASDGRAGRRAQDSPRCPRAVVGDLPQDDGQGGDRSLSNGRRRGPRADRISGRSRRKGRFVEHCQVAAAIRPVAQRRPGAGAARGRACQPRRAATAPAGRFQGQRRHFEVGCAGPSGRLWRQEGRIVGDSHRRQRRDHRRQARFVGARRRQTEQVRRQDRLEIRPATGCPLESRRNGRRADDGANGAHRADDGQPPSARTTSNPDSTSGCCRHAWESPR